MPQNQPPLNFPPPPKRVDFLGPLLKAAQLKFQRNQIEATRAFRERKLEQGDIGLGFERRRVEALEAKAARGPQPTKASLAAAARPGDPAAALDLLDDDTPTKVITRFVKGKGNRNILVNSETGADIADLGPRGKEGSTLEGARRAFLEGKASPEQLALIGQDRAEYIKDYLSVFQGTFLTPRKHANLRRQGEILFQIERLKANPLPANISTTSKAVEFLTSLGFDENQAREIVKQIMRNERAPQR